MTTRVRITIVILVIYRNDGNDILEYNEISYWLLGNLVTFPDPSVSLVLPVV